MRGQERLDGGAELGLAGAGCIEKRGALRGGLGQGVVQERFFVHRDLLNCMARENRDHCVVT